MSFKPQHKSRCYCSKKDVSKKEESTINKTSLSNRRTSSALSMVVDKPGSKSKFIKIKRNGDSDTGHSHKHGLGHSDTNNANYSRRNSVTTTVSTTSNYNNHRAPVPSSSLNGSRRGSIVSVADSEDHSNLGVSTMLQSSSERVHDEDEFTDQRRRYEQSKIIFQIKPQYHKYRQNETFLGSSTEISPPVLELPTLPSDNLIQSLQKFRIDNADDCFNIYRQRDLQMENRLNQNTMQQPAVKVSSPTLYPYVVTGNLWKNNSASKKSIAEHETKTLKTSTNIYTKLQNDKKHILQRPLEKSYALRFQTY